MLTIEHKLISIAKRLNDVIDESTHIAKGAYSQVYVTKKYVYKVADISAVKDYKKETEILNILNNNKRLNRKIPKPVLMKVEKDLVISVQTRLPGIQKTNYSKTDYEQIGKFLKELHRSLSEKIIHEFDGVVYKSLQDYIVVKLPIYIEKLISKLDLKSDVELVKKAEKTIKANLNLFNSDESFVIIHKDLSFNNILFTKDGLSGVIDFGAAQLGLPEWDFAILFQRFNMSRECKNALVNTYGAKLSLKKIAILGIFQSLRFWKTHNTDTIFVNQQRDFIKTNLF